MSALARGRALLILVSTLVVATGPGAAARADVPQVGGEWVYTGSMVTWHFDHTATLLADGDVLVVAGHHRDSAEVYDLASGTWSETGFMAAYHAWGQTATRLADRRVLVAGGDTDFGPSARTELYDPRSRSWRLSGDMALARENHIAAVLPQGRVLVAGGEIPGGSPPPRSCTCPSSTGGGPPPPCTSAASTPSPCPCPTAGSW